MSSSQVRVSSSLFPHQTSCVQHSCLLALPFLPESLQSVGSGCLMGTAIRGVVTWQASLRVAFVGFNTWPGMPRCWQLLSHDSVPSGTALPHSCLQGSTIPREPVGRPELPQPLCFPPHTQYSRPLRNFRHEAHPPGTQPLISVPQTLPPAHTICCYRSLNLVLTPQLCVEIILDPCPWLAHARPHPPVLGP